MEKADYSAVKEYLHFKGMNPSEIHENMVRNLRDNTTPSYAAVTHRVNEFKRHRKSVKMNPDQRETFNCNNLKKTLGLLSVWVMITEYHIVR